MTIKNFMYGLAISTGILTGCASNQVYSPKKVKSDICLDTTELKQKVDSLEGVLKNAGPASFKRMELASKRFNLEYARLIKEHRYFEAKNVVYDEYYDPSNTGTIFEKRYKKYKEDIEERIKFRSEDFLKVYTPENMENRFNSIVDLEDESTFKEAEIFLEDLELYLEEQKEDKSLLNRYKHELEARKIDADSKYDLEKYTKGNFAKRKFKSKLKKYIRKGDMQNATFFLVDAEKYCNHANNSLSNSFIERQNNYLQGVVSEKMGESEESDLKDNFSYLGGFPECSKGDTLEEGFYRYDDQILVVVNFKNSGANPLYSSPEARKSLALARIKADNYLVRYADFVDNKTKHNSQNEKIIGGMVLPYERGGEELPIVGMKEETYQTRFVYSKVRNTFFQKILGYPFTDKMIEQYLKPISFIED